MAADSNNNPYLPVRVEVDEYFREGPDSFTLTVPWDSRGGAEGLMTKPYLPGQFVMVSLPGIGEAAISICSHSEDIMKLNIREVGSVTENLGRLAEGDRLFIRGPYGRGYPMEELQGRDIIMVGGGTGVAPLKGALDYISGKRGAYGKVTLLFGFRSEEDIRFRRELTGWASDYDLTVSFDTLKDKKTAPFGGNEGFVTEFLKVLQIDTSNSAVFTCGPEVMMELTAGILKDKGLGEESIYLSTERLMQCGIGKCGHCMIRSYYSCEDGPVFSYDEIGRFADD